MEPLFYGDWGGCKAWLYQVQKNPVNSQIEKAMHAIGKEVTKSLQNHIKNQDLPWPPHSPNTKNRTGKLLMDTKVYMKSISPRTESNRYSISTKIEPRGIHPKDGLRMDVLAMFHEYGTSKMPSRPLWRIVYNEIQQMNSFKRFTKIASVLGFVK
jgi:phage gpG-like protein